LKEACPKIYEFVKGSETKMVKNMFFKKETIKLLSKEMLSSLSKRHMINRVKKFLPSLKSKDFTAKGTAGIRSTLIDKDGSFLSNPLFLIGNNTLHILNYNSPGATGAFSIGLALTFKLMERGIIKKDREIKALFEEKLVLDCVKDMDFNLIKI
jgi:L-2-hydroxyglutarate oxidase